MNIDILDNDQLVLMDQLISDSQTILVVCHKSSTLTSLSGCPIPIR